MTTSPTIDLSAFTVGKVIPNTPDTPVAVLARLTGKNPDHHLFHRARILEKGEYIEYALILDPATKKWDTYRIKKLNELLAKENANVP